MFDAENEKPKKIKKGQEYLMSPIISYGVKIMSIGFFANPTDAIVWRGPMATKALKEIINNTYKYFEVSAYFEVGTNLNYKIQQLERELLLLGMIARQSGLMVPKTQYRPIEDTNWSTIWRNHYKPI